MFKRGDLVRLRNGKAPIKVLRVDYPFMFGRYISSGINVERRMCEMCYYNPIIAQADLFHTDEGPATLIGTTRNGTYVLEKINDNEEIIYQRKTPTRHKHYTVKLKNIIEGYTFHRAIEEGKVKVNDIIKRPNGKLYQVINIDTKDLNKQPLLGEVLTGKSL